MPPVKVPEGLCCSITSDIFEDPVFTADGHTYERRAIIKWFESNHTSPLTGKELEHLNLVPNHAMKSAVASFLESAKVISHKQFSAAVSAGDMTTLEHCNYLERYLEEDRPFFSAVEAGHTQVVEWLLNAGRSINAVDDKGNTALHCAAAHGTGTDLHTRESVGARRQWYKEAGNAQKSVAMMRALIAAGAQVNALDKQGRPPLFFCASVDAAKVLVEHKADMTLLAANGMSVLHSLIAHPPVFEYVLGLLDAATRSRLLAQVSKAGSTILHCAAMHNPSIPIVFKHYPTVDPFATTRGYTFLYPCINEGNDSPESVFPFLSQTLGAEALARLINERACGPTVLDLHLSRKKPRAALVAALLAHGGSQLCSCLPFDCKS
jgi:hypothetical protein